MNDARPVRVAAVALLILVCAGAVAVPIVARDDLGQISLFYEQFAHIEPVALVLVALFAVAAFASTFGIPALSSDADRRLSETGDASRARSRLVLWTAVAFAFVVVLVGFFVVFEHFYLIDDEYSAWFQAVIFAAGKLHGAVPAEWCGWIGALTPTSVTPHPSSCTWELSFLPLHSLYRSLFLIVHADWLAGPVTAALTIALVASTARKLWPNRPERAWIAVVVLATSMQFLFMSMTMYSMPTHLLCSALWLWLYVDNRRWSIAALPFVGFIALGVHSPIPHGLWIAAFLLRFVRDRRWGVALYVGVGYALALSFWAGHLEIARSVSGSVAGMASGSATVHAVRAPFGFPNALARMTTVMNLALVATWNAPIALLCVIVAALSWRSLDTTSRDLVLSLGVIVVARAVSAPLQGGGWGYRSIYDGMSNIALLAACGVDVMASSIGRRRALGLFAASTAAAVIVQLPLRARQVHAIVAPYARTYRWMTQLPAKVVLFDSEDAMWGSMLLRNDPFLRNSPVLALEYVFTPAGIQDLERRYPGGVHVVTRAELLHLGLEAAPPRIGGSRLP